MGIDVFILAGGRSSRSSTPKPLRSFGGVPWVVALGRMWQRLDVSRVVSVWNPDLPFPDEAAYWGHHAVPNPETDLGPVRSLQVAVRFTKSMMPVTFVTPIDAPPPTPEMFGKLIKALGNSAAVHPEYRGKGGHPVLMTKECLTAILEEDPRTTRLDEFLKRQGALRLPVDDPTVLLNWNDDASWQAWLDLRHGDRWDDDRSWRARYRATHGDPTA